MGRSKWIIGIIMASLTSLLLLILIGGGGIIQSSKETGQISSSDALALTWRASELYCAGIYYTDKVLTADPHTLSYDQWQAYVIKNVKNRCRGRCHCGICTGQRGMGDSHSYRGRSQLAYAGHR